MNLQWVRTSRIPDWPRWAVLVVAGWLALVAAGHVLQNVIGSASTSCLFKRVTGQPCPTCGLTRAVLAGFRGDILAAWRYNPFMVTLLAGWVVMLVVRLLTARRVDLTLSSSQRRWFWGVTGLIFLTNWLYLIWVGR